MSQVDLFDQFTAKPATCKLVIDDFEYLDCDDTFFKEIELSFGSLFINLCFDDDIPDYSGVHVVVYLNSHFNIPIYYRISVINDKGLKWNAQEGRTKVGQGYDSPFGFNCSYIIKSDYLLDKKNGLLPDGKLTIYCEIFELDDDDCIDSGVNKDNLVSLSHDNQSLLDSGKLSDVILKVGKRKFRAHKLILSSRSVVFEKMLEHDLGDSKRYRVKITDMSAGAFENLLKFIYSGKVLALDEHVYELLAAADKYQIDSLKSYCELYLASSLSISTVSKIFEHANLYSLKKLKSKCTKYISSHFAELKRKDFKKLPPKLMARVFKKLGKKFD